MVLQSQVPGVASQMGRSLAVAPSSWTPVEGVEWRLVKTNERNPKTARAEERWRADANDIDSTCRHFNVSIVPSPGLGIELAESTFGDDGLEQEMVLTVVEGLVEGGAAAQHAAAAEADGDGARVMVGDTLIAVHGAAGVSFGVEAASYDQTVEAVGAALGSVPPGEPLTLTLGRIVRRGRALVTAVAPDGSESQVVCYEGENLRLGLRRRGLKLNDATARRYDNKPAGTGDCGGNGLCATCVVSVLQGADCLTPRGPAERTLLQKRFRWRQSCKAYVQCPEGVTDVELKIEVSPRSEADE